MLICAYIRSLRAYCQHQLWEKIKLTGRTSRSPRLTTWVNAWIISMSRIDVPKSRLYKLIRKKDIVLNNKRTDHKAKLVLGDIISVYRGVLQQKPQPKLSQTQWIHQSVIFEDESLLVINKPAGMPVHSGSGCKVGVIDLCQVAFNCPQLSLVHRLDRLSSGVLVMAKGRMAMREYSKLLVHHQWQKFYQVVVHGRWPKDYEGVLVDMLPVKTEAHQSEKNQEARAKFRVVAQTQSHSLLDIKLLTGRKHQIRRQCVRRGFPVVGDQKYGATHSVDMKRMFLHCAKIIITKPDTQKLILQAPLGEALESCLVNWRLKGC